MGLADFILNGGLMGMARGYDHEEEGRPYGFGELAEDLDSAREAVSSGKQLISELEQNPVAALLEVDDE